jgi:hypothetical protein
MGVSKAEMQALIAERGGRSEAEMPVEFKQRVFDVLAKDHAKALFFMFDLESDLDEAMDAGDFKLFREKQLILASMELLEAELRGMMDALMEAIEASTPESETAATLHDLWARVRARRSG